MTEKMPYRFLGKTDIKVSALCLGTMTFGQQTSEIDGHKQLDYAIDKGINFFDTAELYSIPPKEETYGATETIIGHWLKERQNRHDIILASKVVGRSSHLWFRKGKPARLTPKNIRYALENSLKRLQTDYIDLYQIHWPDRHVQIFGEGETTYQMPTQEDLKDEVPIEEMLLELSKLVQEGKIRHIGLSNETAWGVSQFLKYADQGNERIVSIQNAYNLINRTFEINLAEFSIREHIGLLAYSPLAQGYLTGKYLHGARPKGARTTLFDRGGRYQKPGVDKAIEAYLKLADEEGLDPIQMAVAFVTSRPFVTSNIIGATNMSQLEHILGSLDVTITSALEEKINRIHQLNANPAP